MVRTSQKKPPIRKTSASSTKLGGYVQKALAASTIAAYEKDLLRFIEAGNAIPSDPGTVGRYLADHDDHKISTLRRWARGISWAHVTKGYPDPCRDSLVVNALKGIANTKGSTRRQVKPALTKEIRRMVDKLPRNIRGIRDRALLLIGFGAALRRSELAALLVRDIRFENDSIKVTITRSKTDQAGVGQTLTVMKARDARYCVAAALRDWYDAASLTGGPVFRAIHRTGSVGSSPLSGHTIAIVIKQCADRAGFDSANYSGHSLRAGLITSAIIAGKPRHKVKAQSRHKSDAAFGQYIRDTEDTTDNASELF